MGKTPCTKSVLREHLLLRKSVSISETSAKAFQAKIQLLSKLYPKVSLSVVLFQRCITDHQVCVQCKLYMYIYIYICIYVHYTAVSRLLGAWAKLEQACLMTGTMPCPVALAMALTNDLALALAYAMSLAKPPTLVSYGMVLAWPWPWPWSWLQPLKKPEPWPLPWAWRLPSSRRPEGPLPEAQLNFCLPSALSDTNSD